MYKQIITTWFLFFTVLAGAQNPQADSLKLALATAPDDSGKVRTLLQLGKVLMTTSPDEARLFSIQARTLAQKIQYKPGEAFALKNIGMVYYNQTRYVETFDYWNQSYKLFDSLGDKNNAALLLNNIGSVYMNQGNDPEALKYYLRSLDLGEQTGDKHKVALAMTNVATIYSNNAFTYANALDWYRKALAIGRELKDKNVMGGVMVNLGEIYLNQNKTDSALYYFKQSLDAYANTENIPYSLNDIGKTYTKKGDYVRAHNYHSEALLFAQRRNLALDAVQSYLGLGNAYYNQGAYNPALDAYAHAQTIADSINLKKELKEAYAGMTQTYAALQDYKNAFRFQTLFSTIKDSLFNLDVAEKVSTLQSNFEIQKKQTQIDILTKDQALQALELQRQKFARNTLAIGLMLVGGIMFWLFALYRKVGRSRAKLRKSLGELRAAQAQLIQSEKMASLGALTAGVAHEIQNPLNFVNNFSELNAELITELEESLRNDDDKEVQAIISDIRENATKVAYHGKRADAIVKGMLQHSRTNTGKKDATDLNKLADEYLRLSYHGLRAKDKTFNARMVTHFDNEVGFINLVPQDIGRVLLNLFNNAFYAVTQKKQKLGEAFNPTITVHTKKKKNTIEITVQDNGMGISKSLQDKIFQPFFTTKPTGEGTGLGLSLSYDIIKAHNGELKVESTEGEGTTFTIALPL